ncbi:MAG: MBL fold metallo-hydrolase [Arenimonas sp.]
MTINIPVQMLGQSGCRLEFPNSIICMDPYLSNSVQELDGPDLARLMPIPCMPASVTDVDWLLISHEHIDHCDPHTLPELAKASPQARFMGTAAVLSIVQAWGIAPERCVLAREQWQALGPDLRIIATPAAHPEIERDADGNLRYVGYIIDYQGHLIYLAGDTSVALELIDVLMAQNGIDIAFLPVNERNFFRQRRGIIGNMSVREAFLLAVEVGIKQLVPVHWDMFGANSVSIDEIKAVHADMKPGFELRVQPKMLEI